MKNLRPAGILSRNPVGSFLLFKSFSRKTEREPAMLQEIELYIHIPFCVRKCNYCDFLSFPAGEEIQNSYVDALCQEISCAGEYLRYGRDYQVRSIFLGGGTPSVLSIYNTGRILSLVSQHFTLAPGAEISMEANPGTLSPEKLVSYRNAGVNRLSIGLQSADDGCLRMLGRIHSWQDFCENYEQARKAGFDNINIDIMSALPGQSLESYLHTLKEVTALRPEHISSYSLILEEGTPLYDDEPLLKLLPDEETDRRMYEMTKKVLDEEGYHRYEISNYAREGKECIHNLGYWEDIPYLGFGLGASSYWKERKNPQSQEKYLRFSNVRDLCSYIKSPFLPFEEREEYQELSREERMAEFMFLGLRKIRGVDLGDFRDRFGCDMESIYGKPIHKFLDLGLLIMENGRLALTEEGINVSNQIFCEFI